MRTNLRNLVVAKFLVWRISFYFLAGVLNKNQNGVAALDFVDKPSIFPYVVAVKTTAGVCTGTIVNNDWILTAAHCLYSNGDVMAVDDVTIMAGITNYEYPRLDTGQIKTSAEIKLHPRFWNGKLAKFDIALVRVNESFKFNDFVGKIGIAGDEWPRYKEVTGNCMSLGFGGYIGNVNPVKRLKVWNVTAAYGDEECPCSRRFQYKRLVCAKNNEYAKICKGDDGGPLVCGNVVRGIAHMIRNWYICSEDPMYPLENCVGSPSRGLSIYMLLCPFNSWMHGIVPDIPTTPPTCRASVMSCYTTCMLVLLFLFHLIRNKM